MSVFTDRICWEPRIWLGRGKAHPWQVSSADVAGIEVTKVPPPANRAYTVLHTTAGDIHFGIVDPEGLQQATRRVGPH